MVYHDTDAAQLQSNDVSFAFPLGNQLISFINQFIFEDYDTPPPPPAPPPPPPPPSLSLPSRTLDCWLVRGPPSCWNEAS